MDEDERILRHIIAEERRAAELVAQLVRDGFTVDQAFALVRFPHDD